MRARRRLYRVELILADVIEVMAASPSEAVRIVTSRIPRRDARRVTHTRVKDADDLIVADWQRHHARDGQ